MWTEASCVSWESFLLDIATRDLSGNELWWLQSGPGAHTSEPVSADENAEHLRGMFRFVEETGSTKGLRSAQLGALHAILAHRSTEDPEPITIVMPTGTGKTETMLAAFCYSPERTLVLVPSDALRTQTANKFVSLGILPDVGAVGGDFRCPAVLVLKSAPTAAADVGALVLAANVVVATAQVLSACSAAVRETIVASCSRLFVDEAHHGAAPTWRSIVDAFVGREIVQFTATPYREDGRHIGGRIAYAYPLRLAQRHGLFASIAYRSVVDLADPDRAVATAAVQQLRDDLGAGFDHLLMARVSSVERAKQIIKVYEELASDLTPVRIDTGLHRRRG